MPKKHKVCIIGAEGWGSAISTAVCGNVLKNDFDPRVHIYVYDELVRSSYLSEVMNERHENIKYLPGIELSKNLIAVNDLIDAAGNADILIFATPQDFVKPYCNILAGKIKSTAYAVSLIKGLDHIKDGEIELYSHSIAKQLQIPCYSVMNANSAMEMAQGKLCEITIGCNNTEHVQELTKLFQTENCKVFSVDDVDGVELCNTLKDMVAISAGFVDGLRLGENARIACLHLGLKEMMRFIKSYNPSTKLSTFFESCGIANSVVSSYADKNVTFAKSFVTSRKTVQEIEANLLNGRKLLGPVIAEEIYGYLEKHNLKEKYPIFTVIHRICKNEVSPDAILDTLRNHPDLSNYSLTELQKDEFLLSSLDEKVTENVADTVPEPNPDSMRNAIFEKLEDKTLQSFTDQNEGFWKPYHQYFSVPENASELRQFLNKCQQSINASVAMNETGKDKTELTLEIGSPSGFPTDRHDISNKSPKFLNPVDSQQLTDNTTWENEQKANKRWSVVMTAKSGENNKQIGNGLKNLIEHHVKPFNQRYEALKVRVKSKDRIENESPEIEELPISKLKTSTKINLKTETQKAMLNKENQKSRSNDYTLPNRQENKIEDSLTESKPSKSAKTKCESTKGEHSKVEKKPRDKQFKNESSMFGMPQSDNDRGVPELLDYFKAREIENVEPKVIGNEPEKTEYAYKFDFNKDYKTEEDPFGERTFKSDEIISKDLSNKEFYNVPLQCSEKENPFRPTTKELAAIKYWKNERREMDKRAKNQTIQTTDFESRIKMSKRLEGFENLEDEPEKTLRREGKNSDEAKVPKGNLKSFYEHQRTSNHISFDKNQTQEFENLSNDKMASKMEWEYARKLRADDFEEEQRFLPLDKQDPRYSRDFMKKMNQGKSRKENKQSRKGKCEQIDSEINSPFYSKISDSDNEIFTNKAYHDNQDFGVQPETEKFKQESTENVHPYFLLSNNNQERSEKTRNYSLDSDDRKPCPMRETEEKLLKLSSPKTIEEHINEIRQIEKGTQDMDEEKRKSKLQKHSKNSKFTVQSAKKNSVQEILSDEKPSNNLEEEVSKYDNQYLNEQKEMDKLKQEITKKNYHQITESKEKYDKKLDNPHEEYFHVKNEHGPEWNWLLDEIKDEDESETKKIHSSFDKKEKRNSRKLKKPISEKSKKNTLDRKETATDAAEEAFDDESTKSTRKTHAPEAKDQDEYVTTRSPSQKELSNEDQAFDEESSKTAYKVNTPKAKEQETYESTKFRPQEENSYEEKNLDEETSRTIRKEYAPKAKDRKTYNSTKFTSHEEDSYEENTFDDETSRTNRKEYSPKAKNLETYKTTKFMPQEEDSYEDKPLDDESKKPAAEDQETYKSKKLKEMSHEEKSFEDDYKKAVHKAFDLEAEDQETYNSTKGIPQAADLNKDDAFQVESSKSSGKDKRTELLPQTEPSYEDSLRYMTPLAKGQSKKKMNSESLLQHEGKFNPKKKSKKEHSNKEEQSIQSIHEKSEKSVLQKETPLQTIKTKVSQMSLTKKLVDIMGTGKQAKELSPKEEKVEYSGKNPYISDVDILPKIKIKSQNKKVQDMKRKLVPKPMYHPPINPRVRVPRPPFDVREHEYHTVNYRPPPDLFRKSVLPQRMTATYQVKQTATKNVTKLPRPILKLPTSFMRSSILAVELGLFAALLSRYKGSCK